MAKKSATITCSIKSVVLRSFTSGYELSLITTVSIGVNTCLEVNLTDTLHPLRKTI